MGVPRAASIDVGRGADPERRPKGRRTEHDRVPDLEAVCDEKQPRMCIRTSVGAPAPTLVRVARRWFADRLRLFGTLRAMTGGLPSWSKQAVAFVAGVGVTLAAVFVFIPTVTAPRDHEPGPDVPTRVGGSLQLSGDHTASVALFRATVVGDGVEGDGARMLFGRDPVAVSQLSVNGLQFFPEPSECSVTTGAINHAIGIVETDVECSGISEVRGKGVVSVTGTLGLPATLVASRGDLPDSGGSLQIGSETIRFEDARLRTWTVAGESPYHMELTDDRTGLTLSFSYDHHTHAIALADIARGAEGGTVLPGACAARAEEIGRLSPHDPVVQLSLRCHGVDVPGMGTVGVEGQLVVDVTERRG